MFFAYTSETSIESLLDNFYELNQNVELDSQISMICILNKGLILRTYNSKIGNICLVPEPETTLGYCKNPLEYNFYIFYLLLMNALNRMQNLPPDLMTYAEKQGALNIQTIYPSKYMSKDGTYGLGGISLDGEFIKKFPEFQNKLIRYQGGQMSKDELLAFYFKDSPQYAETINRIFNNGKKAKFTIGDQYVGVDMNMLKNLFEKKLNGQSLSESESALYKKQSDEMHKQYVLMVNVKKPVN